MVLLGVWALYQAIYAAQHSCKDALGLHHLLGRAHAGGAGGFLLKARHGLGRGGGHRDRNGGDAGLGRARREELFIFRRILAQRDAIFPALFAAVAALVVVSLFTPKPSAEQLAKFAE